MKRTGIIVLLLTLLLTLQSHDLWLEPIKFNLKAGETLILDFKEGDNFMGNPWDLGKQKPESLLLINEGNSQDILSLVPTTRNGRLKLPMTKDGIHLLSMTTKNELIESNAQDFNSFLQEEALDEAYNWRVQRKQENKNATQFYKRYSKLLIQVGEGIDNTWKKILGHKLEIIPLKNPVTSKSGDYMDCQILLEGKPVPHTKVKIWGHVGNKIFLQNAYTEDDGTVRFPISAPGPWLVSTIQVQRSKTVGAEWEYIRSTLVFNVR